MTAKRVCYFKMITGDGRVRFGFDLRADCQVEVSRGRWKKISAKLRYRGYQLVEQGDDRSGSSTRGRK